MLKLLLYQGKPHIERLVQRVNSMGLGRPTLENDCFRIPRVQGVKGSRRYMGVPDVRGAGGGLPVSAREVDETGYCLQGLGFLVESPRGRSSKVKKDPGWRA